MATVNLLLLDALLSLLHDVVEEGHVLGAAVGDLGVGLSLTRGEVQALAQVAAAPGVGVGGLAAQQGVTPSAASQVASRLVKKGLLQRTRQGRAVRLAPTALGVAALQAHQRLRQQQVAAALPAYSSNVEVQRDLEALVRLQDILRRCAQPPPP